MALKQTRRSISVRGETYDRLRIYADAKQLSMSEVVEELLAPVLNVDSKHVAMPEPTPATISTKRRPDEGW